MSWKGSEEEREKWGLRRFPKVIERLYGNGRERNMPKSQYTKGPTLRSKEVTKMVVMSLVQHPVHVVLIKLLWLSIPCIAEQLVISGEV